MSTVFSTPFQLTTLNGLKGFTINGVNATDESGSAFAAGDFNGDGKKDLAIGANYASPGGQHQAGYVAILFGKKTPWNAVIELSSLDGTIGSLVTGILASNSGSSLAVGDLNGDGIDDLVIGGWQAETTGLTSNYADAGACYVLFGHKSAWSASFSLSSLNGNNGFTLQGISEVGLRIGEQLCTSVAVADFNGDGIDDLLAGAPAYWTSTAYSGPFGAVVALYGKKTAWNALMDVSSIDGNIGVIFLGDNGGDTFGQAVAAGDLNGDGIKDYIMSAADATPNGIRKAGITYVVFGQKASFGSATFQIYNINGSNGCMFYGVNSFDQSGLALASGKDINGDKIHDLLIGAPDASTNGNINNGNVYVYFGKNNSWTATVELSALSGSDGFTIWGESDGDHCGQSLALGNVNGDKFADPLLGAPGAGYSGGSSSGLASGKTYLLYGQKTWPALFYLSDLDSPNSSGCIFNDINADAYSGTAVGFSDLNGDGIDDVTIGAVGAAPGGRSQAGASYVAFGKNASAIIVGPSSSSSTGGTSCGSCSPSSTGTAGNLGSSTGTAGGLGSSTGTGTGIGPESSSTGLTGAVSFSSSSTAVNGVTGISSSSGAAIQQSSSGGVTGQQQSSSGAVTGQQQSSSGAVTGQQQSSSGGVTAQQQSSSGGNTGIKQSSSGGISGQQQSSSGGDSGLQQSSSAIDSSGQASGQNSGYGDSSSSAENPATSNASKTKPWLFSALGSAFSMARSYGGDLLSSLNPLSIGSIASHFTFEASDKVSDKTSDILSGSPDVPFVPVHVPVKESGTPIASETASVSAEPSLEKSEAFEAFETIKKFEAGEAEIPHETSQEAPLNSNFKMPSLSKTDYLAIAPLILHHALPLVRQYSPITLPWNKIQPLSENELDKLNQRYTLLLEKEKIRQVQKDSHAEKSGLFKDTSKFIDKEIAALKNEINKLLGTKKGSSSHISDVNDRMCRVQEKIHELAKLNKDIKKLDVKIKRNQRKHPGSPTIAAVSHDSIQKTLKQRLVSPGSKESMSFLLDAEKATNGSIPASMLAASSSNPLLFSNSLGLAEKRGLGSSTHHSESRKIAAQKLT